MNQPQRSLRLAAVGDLHCTRASAGVLGSWLAPAARLADVLVLCGDLTDHGTPEEARILADELATVPLPVVAVLGNHDFGCGQAHVVAEILGDAGVTVLAGAACTIQGVGFAGTKGFGGGFGARALVGGGEKGAEGFVREIQNEAQRLEAALAGLDVERRVVVLHYAPVRDTLEGEALELYPFLGSSRLEEALARSPVRAVFHGHAHKGRAEGQTVHGVPVYNVALPLLRRVFPGQMPFRIVEV